MMVEAITPKENSVVQYEQDSKPILAIIKSINKNKYLTINSSGQELSLSADRMFVLTQVFHGNTSNKSEVCAYLSELYRQAEEQSKGISGTEIWELFRESYSEISEHQLCDYLFSSITNARLLAVRLALLEDNIHFRRKKDGFDLRSESAVEELLKQKQVLEQKRQTQIELANAVSQKLRGGTVTWPASLSNIIELACLEDCPGHLKDWGDTLISILDQEKLGLPGSINEKAFALLVRIGVFSEDENTVLRQAGIDKTFSPEIQEEVSSLLADNQEKHEVSIQTIDSESAKQEKHSTLIFSIDSESTLDIDDALSLEKYDNRYVIGIHISNVAKTIHESSILDMLGIERASSIYLPDQRLQMFPSELSEGLFSLQKDLKRSVISFYVELDTAFNQISYHICENEIRVSHRLSYHQVDDLLNQDPTANEPSPELSALTRSLSELYNIAEHFISQRCENGAFAISRKERTPVVNKDGTVLLETYDEEAPSRKLVSEMMVLACACAADYANKNQIPLVFRGQPAPDPKAIAKAENYPEGPARDYYLRSLLKKSTLTSTPSLHSGLGLNCYCQATSPIRRYSDLLNQRQIRSHLNKAPLAHTREQIDEIISQLSARLAICSQIQKTGHKYFMLKYLKQNCIKELKATVIKLDGNKPLADIDLLGMTWPFNPPRSHNPNNPSYKLGQTISLRVDVVDPRRSYLSLRG